MFTEIVILFLLVILGGLFAMTEIAIVSARRSRLEQLAQEGDIRAEIALGLAKNPQNFLSTIQCGFTLVSIVTGVFGGARIADHLTPHLQGLPLIGNHAEAVSVSVVVIVLTYVTIIIGELVPKTVALVHAESIAIFFARPIQTLLRVTHPFVVFLSGSTNFVLKLIGVEQKQEHELTQDEFEIMVEQGAESGAIEKAEQQMVEGVLELGDKTAKLFMTQRKDIVWLDINEELSVSLHTVIVSQHSHFPVCDGTIDNVLGMLNIKAVLTKYKEGAEIDLRQLLTPPLFVPDNTPALRVLSQFKEHSTHIALVLDEYGSLEGLVALNDLVEPILGDMESESSEEPAIVTREDGSWLVDGSLPNDSLRELLAVEELYEEERGDYQTLAGMILSIMGKIPQIGDVFSWSGYRFEIVDMDDNRIDRVMIGREIL